MVTIFILLRSYQTVSKMALAVTFLCLRVPFSPCFLYSCYYLSFDYLPYPLIIPVGGRILSCYGFDLHFPGLMMLNTFSCVLTTFKIELFFLLLNCEFLYILDIIIARIISSHCMCCFIYITDSITGMPKVIN